MEKIINFQNLIKEWCKNIKDLFHSGLIEI